MLYFAYGSNMNVPHLREHITSHGVDTEGLGLPQPGALHGYKLRTNYLSSTHAAGACNIGPAQGSIVEGLVLHISSTVLDVLRIKEGWPHRYEEVMVDVLNGDRREPVQALTYIVAAEHRLDKDMPVTPHYRGLVLVGAEDAGLSKSYQEQLARMLRTTGASFRGIAGEGSADSRHMAPSSIELPR